MKTDIKFIPLPEHVRKGLGVMIFYKRPQTRPYYQESWDKEDWFQTWLKLAKHEKRGT